MTKLCVICSKPLTGRQRTLCSEKCRKERAKEKVHKWRQDNPERTMEYSRKYRQKNKQRISEKGREYYQANAEKIKEFNRKHYQDNQERRKEYQYEYSQKNKERIKEHAHEYYQDNQKEILENKCRYYQNNWGKISEYGRKKYRISRGLPEDWDLSRESSIEAIIKRWLQDSNIEFMQQHYVNLKALGANWTKVDFFIEPNICLYSDGDYWHGPENPDVQERDTRINRALEEKGHVVIRLSESDILAGARPVEILELIQ